MDRQLLTEGFRANDGTSDLLAQMKSYATHVRGMMYPHQYRSYAHALYAPHDAWFTKNFGFTIDDAIKMAKAITDEYARRNWESKESSRKAAQQQADTFIKEGQACEADRHSIVTSIGCQLHFGNATNLFAFTEEQLATFSRVPTDVAASFLRRMSQGFGYRNPLFPNTFTAATSAPSDYNTLYERPIITHQGKYWLVVPPILGSVLMATFYFDLLRDKQYRPLFDKARASFLEEETATYLRRSFPASSVVLNPCYPNNEEMTDVLVLHDRKVIIVQCKSKLLTHNASVGESFEQLCSDMDKGIKEAFDQGLKARDYLNATLTPEVIINGKSITVDMGQVNAIHIISITLSSYQDLTVRFANHPALQRLTGSESLWSLSLDCLDVLTQFLSSPARFLHYLDLRLEIEKKTFDVLADEMDVLGYYITRGNLLSRTDLRHFDKMSISGVSTIIDQYVYERYEMGLSPALPQPTMQKGFQQFLTAIEDSTVSYATDCALTLLDLNDDEQEAFIKAVQQAKETISTKKKTVMVSLVLEDGESGVSFCVAPTETEDAALFAKMMFLASAKKYETRCHHWVAFGWKAESVKELDVMGYLS